MKLSKTGVIRCRNCTAIKQKSPVLMLSVQTVEKKKQKEMIEWDGLREKVLAPLDPVGLST